MPNPKSFILTLLLLTFLTILTIQSAYAVDCQWVETDGEAVLENMTVDGTRLLAINRARVKAIEKVSSLNIQASTLITDLSVIDEIIKSVSNGHIVNDEVLGWEINSLQKERDTPPVITYTVNMRVCVVKSLPGDPYFKVNASLNRTVFKSGENATIKAVCTKDCYLTIANLTAERKVRILLPNAYEPSVGIKADEVFIFPPKGLALEIRTIEGHPKDTEAIIVLATKEKFDILSYFKKDGDDITLKDFYNTVLSLPATTRSEDILLYEVRGEE